MPVHYQTNLRTEFGGGEFFTRFFSEAFVDCGWTVLALVGKMARCRMRWACAQ